VDADDLEVTDQSKIPTWIAKLWILLARPLPDPNIESNPQRAEEWALMEFVRLREELRSGEEAKRRSFVQGQICARITDGHSRASAARLSGVTTETVSRWMRADPGFAAAMAQAQGLHVVADRTHWRLKMTAPVQETLVRMLGCGVTRKEAAASVGISRQTFYTWLNQRPDFRDAVLAAEAQATGGRQRGARRPPSRGD
jgi:hypothetical protein